MKRETFRTLMRAHNHLYDYLPPVLKVKLRRVEAERIRVVLKRHGLDMVPGPSDENGAIEQHNIYVKDKLFRSGVVHYIPYLAVILDSTNADALRAMVDDPMFAEDLKMSGAHWNMEQVSSKIFAYEERNGIIFHIAYIIPKCIIAEDIA